MTTMTFPSVRTDGLTLILGLGETGVAAARWCVQHGAGLRVLDTREAPGGLGAMQAELDAARVDYRLGRDGFEASALQDVHTIVLSPGLAPGQEPLRSFLEMARARQIEVVGEIELFARALADMAGQGYQPRILAVTGTNGKTTVTAMTRRLLEASGLSARVAGNISPAALDALRDALTANALPDVWVLELSSFQLEAIYSLKVHAGVVLNVTQDHLDWHGSMQAYAAAKARLVGMAETMIVNRDDERTVAMVADIGARNVRSFGRNAPVLEGDMGLDASDGIVWLAASEAQDFDLPAVAPKRGKKAVEPPRAPGRTRRLMPADALRIRGQHNALNALAALALARCLGLGWAGLLNGVREYAGEPHRTEFVRSIGGVDFVNDSKGTNVGATVAALEGMDERVVLIAGGQGKGQDFSPLAHAVRGHAGAVVLFGQDAGLIEAALADAGIPLARVDSLRAAVERGFELAEEGDTVLLSPACASLDMFPNYKVRGERFVDEVNELALSRGEVA
ncbi:UDP-N-acetylmuramoyl-L-alanine--D-glutamate ligase [Alcaligenaceae bacterium]|nr:UDP-N-acetylmuramoyl-L-alanine--D-glutamate ligase [Alcaligenaceae bacterium]